MDTDDPNVGLPPSSPPRSSSPPAVPSNRDGPASRPTQSSAPRNGGIDDNDDEAFWKALDAGIEDPLSDAPPAPSTGPNSSMDEDEDMWDLVNEIEETSSASKALSVAQGPQPEHQPADDDWDDMYV